MVRWWLGAVLAFSLAGAARAEPAAWAGLGWLTGSWIGEGGGAQQGAGGFSFTPEAAGKVLIRRNVADYPAQGGKPAQHHEDFMVIFPQGERVEADYWDSEGQRIHYVVSSPQAGEVVFLSDAGPGPRFRLTYRQRGPALDGQFEIAPPGKLDQFASYLTWTARRRP